MRRVLEEVLNEFTDNFNKLFTNKLNNSNNNINETFNTRFIDIITIFNNELISFTNEYQQLTPLNLSEIEKLYFYISSDDSDLLIIDLFNVKENIYNENNWISLELTRKNEKYKAYLSNGHYLSNDKYHERININSYIIKQYLNLMKKYNKLLNTFAFFKECYLCNGNIFLHIKLNDNILNNLSTFTICLGNDKININLTFSLKNDLKIIDYDLKIEGIKEIKKVEKKEIIIYLLNNLYISNNELSSLYKNDDEYNIIDKKKVLKKIIH